MLEASTVQHDAVNPRRGVGDHGHVAAVSRAADDRGGVEANTLALRPAPAIQRDGGRVGGLHLREGINADAFVEVAAGTVGFVLVTTLPESEGSSPHLAEAGVKEGNLTDDELVELMTEADPARIRAALPRMSPEMQQVAQAVLNEIEAQKP